MKIAHLAALTLCGCSALGAGAEYAPTVLRLADTVAEHVKKFERDKGLKASRYQCEHDWLPNEKRLLMLCDVRFEQ